MLGKLARWLRLLGYEVDYSNAYSDKALLEKASCQSSVLITADEALFKTAINRKIDSMLIKGGAEQEKIAKVIKRYNLDLDPDPNRSRCTKCGSQLNEMPKETLRDRVPPKSFHKYMQFWVCKNSRCNKVYWRGSHWDNIQKRLDAVKSILKEK